MCFESSERYYLRNDEVHDLKQTLEVSIKLFCRKWEGETPPKWLFLFKQLEKCQNEYYPYNPFFLITHFFVTFVNEVIFSQ